MPKPKSAASKPRSAKEKAQDGLVMQTNSSSIVSKRSVERLYYPNEPHFFRYFVTKFQRRAPLINRGYHLRLHVIDVAVRRFLQRKTDKTKVVVNLGCGSDVLPWQSITRYPEACHDAKFIDIDFPDLMQKKRAIVLSTPELRAVFDPLDADPAEHVLLRSHRYAQVGCDLRSLADLEKAVRACCDAASCTFLFVAEVSLTYMETPAADAVIEWASSLGQAEFCLLEQILPEGPRHPFAVKMLGHFEKLNTPPKSAREYPRLELQRDRFSRLGWSWIQARSLWQAWYQNEWISPEQRRELDQVEPFDEWEEFSLFGSHYCVVIARNHLECEPNETLSPEAPPAQSSPIDLQFNEYKGIQGKRRFGASFNLRDNLGRQVVANTYGLGTNNRLRSCDLYAPDPPISDIQLHSSGPSGRVCHALVDLGFFGSLLVGGRISPGTVLRDCWRFSPESNRWSQAEDLPIPLYRHAITQLGNSSMVLLLGGKTDSSTLFGDALIYRPSSGWTQCTISCSQYQPVFGALLFKSNRTFTSDVESTVDSTTLQFHGYLAGGLLRDGTVANQLLRWTLTLRGREAPTLSLQSLLAASNTHGQSMLSKTWRFSASVVQVNDDHVAIVGGVSHDGVVPWGQELMMVKVHGSELQILSYHGLGNQPTPRPLLIGASITMTEYGQLLLMGGGATCFSMGTFWNEGSFTSKSDIRSLIGERKSLTIVGPLRYRQTVEITEDLQPPNGIRGRELSQQASLEEVSRVRIKTQDEFDKLLKAGKPVIIEASNLGECVHMWTTEYLSTKVGPDKMVVVHEAQSAKMDFKAKNFTYNTKAFGTFISEIERGEKQYLRSLAERGPSNLPANLESDFPSLMGDFRLPPELSYVEQNLFSSVLRISGRVNMWLHYDVMANVYCQITGSKRVLLYPPKDVHYLSFAPGASSSSIDVFSELNSPVLSLTQPHEARLEPGDVLFLPPTWLHAAAPLSDVGVAVNLFFRNLETGYSSGRDVYGNRDVAAYEKGRQDIARMASSLGKLPVDMRTFYARRLADELIASVVG